MENKPLIERSKHFRRFIEFIRYIAIASIGGVLDITVFTILTSFTSMHYLIVNFISVSIAITNNFFMNAHFNFKIKTRFLRRYLQLDSLGLFGLFINTSSLFCLVEFIDLNKFYAKIATQAVVTIILFLLNKFITFRKKHHEKPHLQ